MATKRGKFVTAISDRSSVWPTFLETNRPFRKVFVKIGPTAWVLTSLSDLYYESNVNEELLNIVQATVVTTLMTVN